MKKLPVQTCQQNLFELAPIDPQPKEDSKSTQDAFVLDLLDSLSSPILTFSQSWADAIPERLLNLVPMARMISLKKQEHQATYVEIAIYIFTRTMEAPMDSEWVDIYTHVCCSVCQDWFNEDHWEDVHAPKKLSDWLRAKLDGLRRHIYQKRRDILKSRMKATAAEQKKERKPDPEPADRSEQTTLFS